jgi:hypothetical protein
MFRQKIGSIAIVLLAAGGLLLAVDADSRNVETLRGACLQIGVFMALLWLAEPQLRTLPAWLLPAVVVLPLLLIARPRLFPLGLVAVVVLWFMRPRRRERQGESLHGTRPTNR